MNPGRENWNVEDAGGAYAWHSVQERSRIARVLWGLLAGVCTLGGLAMAGAGLFAPPEWEKVHHGHGAFAVNVMRLFLVGAGVLLPAGVFCTWKSAHRAGLGFWRASARPALMAGSAAMSTGSLVFSTFFSAGPLQFAGLSSVAVSAAAFLLFWILRGPSIPALPGDVYWNRALATVFSLLALASSAGVYFNARSGSNDGFAICSARPMFTHEHREQTVWDRGHEEWVTSEEEIQVPTLQYRTWPVWTGLLAVVTLGSMAEVRHRWKQAGRSRFGG